MASYICGGCWNEARDETDGGRGEWTAAATKMQLHVTELCARLASYPAGTELLTNRARANNHHLLNDKQATRLNKPVVPKLFYHVQFSELHLIFVQVHL